MQALGLIETRGLIAAVESADAMLKAAEVTLLEKTYVGGGLVSIAVTGGVAAVKAAVEAGAAAVKQINGALLVSQHVIPRPSEELDELIVPIKTHEEPENQNVGSAGAGSEEKAAVAEIVAEASIAEVPADDGYPEAKGTPSVDIDLNELTKEAVDKIVQQAGWEKAFEVLNGLKVIKLRNLAREYGNMRIAGRMISKADKKMLLAEFEEHYKIN